MNQKEDEEGQINTLSGEYTTRELIEMFFLDYEVDTFVEEYIGEIIL